MKYSDDGNPDIYGYPHEHDDNCHINVKGGSGRNCDCSYKEVKSGQTN